MGFVEARNSLLQALHDEGNALASMDACYRASQEGQVRSARLELMKKCAESLSKYCEQAINNTNSPVLSTTTASLDFKIATNSSLWLEIKRFIHRTSRYAAKAYVKMERSRKKGEKIPPSYIQLCRTDLEGARLAMKILRLSVSDKKR